MAASQETVLGDAIQVDVVIIGGGIVGLWLLNDLHKHDYSAVLLEKRELGGGQTCHSHVYIHQGYMYTDASLASGLRGVNEIWASWLSTRALGPRLTSAYFGFPNEADAQRRRDFWNSPGLTLPHKLVPLPAALRGGSVRIVFESPEFCLNGEWLVRELAKDVDRFITAIDDVRPKPARVVGRGYGWKVESLVVTINGGKEIVLKPKVVVLSAGAGNQALLHYMSGGDPDLLGAVQAVQQIRKAHMLVIRGRKGDMEPLSGVFPDIEGLFIVSRELSNHIVWLVSDNQSPPIWFSDQWIAYDSRRWLARVLPSLAWLAPEYFEGTAKERFEWGIYEAPKAEGKASGSLPNETRIEQCGFQNVWAVWPSKLTLAPAACSQIMTKLREPNSPCQTPTPWMGFPPAWDISRSSANVAPERWTKVPLLSWPDFCRCYL